MLTSLDEVINRLNDMKPEAKSSLVKLAYEKTKNLKIIPNVGQQTKAYFSSADIILYGGAGGGGKSYLVIALAIQKHLRSIIFRREASQTDGLIANAKAVIGDDANFNGSDLEFNYKDGRNIKFAGLAQPDDWMKHAGRERDLMAFDEAGEFLESQVASLQAWNRGPEGVHCQILLASNPPRTAEGAWLKKWFAPWLDPKFPFPARDGEIRWAVYWKGETVWVDGPEPVEMDGEMVYPKSRTFIGAMLKDNPFRDTNEYRASLQALPETLRKQMLHGDFAAGEADDAFQTIPTSWVREAQRRWTPTPPRGVPMCGIGVDVAQGGCFDNETEILTDTGWMLFSLLTGEEKVLSLEGEQAVWAPIQEIHTYHHDGVLNYYEGRRTNFAITDNHNLIVRSPKGVKYKIARYDALPRVFVMKRTNRWQGVPLAPFVFKSVCPMPNGGERTKQWVFDPLDWAKFLGWFVSEGCAVRSKPNRENDKIDIAQNEGSKLEEIKQLLTKMGIKFTSESKSRAGVEFVNAPIGQHLTHHCGKYAKNKRIPKYVKEASTDVITSFLETFRKGDGTVGANGQVSYFTSSKQLADDIQEVLVKIGRAGKMSTRVKAGSTFTIGTRQVVRKNDVYVVYERTNKQTDTEILKSKVERRHYEGYVYCVTTPNRTIHVRRKGCTMWSGNSDKTVIAPRYDGWYAPLIPYPGVETPDGKTVAGKVIQHRRDNCPVAIDIGGGWGGDAHAHLRVNNVDSHAYMGVKDSNKRTVDKQLKFTNVRTEAYWRFREALDPSQPQGSTIALPDDPELVADLCAPMYKIGPRGIAVEPKADVVKRLGRSPDRGDAVIMAWWVGPTQANIEGGWTNRKTTPKVNLGRTGGRRR